jgi:phosphoglycerate dehydrogenase-like enzyme
MKPARVADVCSGETRQLFESRFELRWGSANLNTAELGELVSGSDIVLTSWGTPQLTAAMLADGPAPKVIAHAAGSIKNLIEPAAFDSGLTVFSAAARIALSVGEYCLGAALTLLRRLPEFDDALRAGHWKPAWIRGNELAGRTVGIVGASSTARAFIALLKPFGVDVVVYDPYLSAERAAGLGVRRGTLEDVAGADIVSIHVPNLPETEGMISRTLIEGMRPGTIVINSSRGPAIDNPALMEAVVSGRLFAALDVYQSEPPQLPAALTGSPNVLLTPHIAGDTLQGHLALAGFVLADVIAWLDHGRRGPSFVDPAALALSA